MSGPSPYTGSPVSSARQCPQHYRSRETPSGETHRLVRVNLADYYHSIMTVTNYTQLKAKIIRTIAADITIHASCLPE